VRHKRHKSPRRVTVPHQSPPAASGFVVKGIINWLTGIDANSGNSVISGMRIYQSTVLTAALRSFVDRGYHSGDGWVRRWGQSRGLSRSLAKSAPSTKSRMGEKVTETRCHTTLIIFQIRAGPLRYGGESITATYMVGIERSVGV
jgi:hypothetical protein